VQAVSCFRKAERPGHTGGIVRGRHSLICPATVISFLDECEGRFRSTCGSSNVWFCRDASIGLDFSTLAALLEGQTKEAHREDPSAIMMRTIARKCFLSWAWMSSLTGTGTFLRSLPISSGYGHPGLAAFYRRRGLRQESRTSGKHIPNASVRRLYFEAACVNWAAGLWRITQMSVT
jgi:hypothetical protein